MVVSAIGFCDVVVRWVGAGGFGRSVLVVGSSGCECDGVVGYLCHKGAGIGGVDLDDSQIGELLVRHVSLVGMRCVACDGCA